MSGRFQGHQTTLWRAEQLEQVRVARPVLAKRAGATEHLAVFTHHCHHVTLGSNVDSRKPHQPSSFHDPVPGASEPELTLLLVHCEDATCASGYRSSPEPRTRAPI